MARVTTEDCTTEIPNRFELIMTAAQRVRKISAGSPITVSRDKDKNTVISLREIAGQTIDLDELREDMVQSYQRVHETDDNDVDLAELISSEAALQNEEMLEQNGVYAAEEDDMDVAPTDDEMLKSLAGDLGE